MKLGTAEGKTSKAQEEGFCCVGIHSEGCFGVGQALSYCTEKEPNYSLNSVSWVRLHGWHWLYMLSLIIRVFFYHYLNVKILQKYSPFSFKPWKRKGLRLDWFAGVWGVFLFLFFNSSWPLLSEIMLDMIPGIDNIFEPLRTLKLDGICKDISHVSGKSFS